MTLNDIPPDTSMKLTNKLERLFRWAGCEPMCHACTTSIEIGETFRLATYTPPPKFKGYEQESRDAMVCANCTVEDLISADQRDIDAWLRRGGGYSRPSLMVNT